jgi:serine/threonine-protein kinase
MAFPEKPVFKGFKIIKAIGSGGMSTVYEAVDKKLNRRVALKILHPHLHKDKSAIARFKREALAAAKIDHPNIVRIYDFLYESGMHCIVMEYVPGLDMDSVIKKKGGIPFETAQYIMYGVALALKEAHSHQMLHRDVKPSNILLRKDNRVMLSDFGLARQPLDTHLTVRNAVAGTPGFMSPEQISGREITFSSDIYSWAITFYYLLAGKLPYSETDYGSVINAIQAGKVVMDNAVKQKIPVKFLELIERCLINQPGHRIPDGMELKKVLDSYSDIRTINFHTVLDFEGGDAKDHLTEKSVSQTVLYRSSFFTVKKASILLIVILLLGAGTYFGISGIKRVETMQNVPQDSSRIKTVLPDTQKTPQVVSIVPDKQKSKTHVKAVQREVALAVTEVITDSGKLFISCGDSLWANVMIDGKYVGQTPLEKPITLPRGRHLIKLYSEFIEPLTDEVKIIADTTIWRDYVLKIKPAYR